MKGKSYSNKRFNILLIFPCDVIQTSLDLTSLLQEKLDLASHDLLLHASELADPETSNLQYVINNDVITLCMWGNLSKNPR